MPDHEGRNPLLEEKPSNGSPSKRRRRRKTPAGIQKPVSESVQLEVGYKRPPPDKQFKKGQSGFPSGRPRGSKNKPKLAEGVYHLEQAFASGIISFKAPPKPKTSTSDRYFRKRSSDGFPRREHCYFDDHVKFVTIFGPLNQEEDKAWQDLVRREVWLMDDLIGELKAVIEAEDAYTKREMGAAAARSEELLEEIRAQKEKYRRRMRYEEFEALGKAKT